MRIVLKDNKQKELIDKEKEALNLSFNGLAKRLGIKYGRLIAYYYDNVLLPKDIFEKFSVRKEFVKHIIDKKEDTWGKVKGGHTSTGNTKKIKIPNESKKLAEFYGIMLGDGNLTVKKAYKIGTYQIRIVGDSRHDKEYLINYAKPLIENLFEIKVKISKQKDANALYLTSTSKKLSEFLEIKGFKPGDKIKNQLEIPSWIKKTPEFLRKCLRGLYDTDGSIYKLTNQNSHQISFRNYNITLMNDVRNSLLSLGVGVSKISKGNEITITRKTELRKFLNEVGFSNNKHLNKVKMWNLAP